MAPLAGISYRQCTCKELRSFIKARIGGPRSDSRTKKAELIRILEQDDASNSFRFLDLVAEMRNEVYGYLLTLRPGGQGDFVCDTAILGCCKKVSESLPLHIRTRLTIY